MDGSTGVGDNSGLLRQQLIDEFEDDDIVMFMIQHLVKGLEHPEQTKAVSVPELFSTIFWLRGSLQLISLTGGIRLTLTGDGSSRS